MAYGTKYYMEWETHNGEGARLEIQQDGYSSSATELQPATTPIDITWGQQGRKDFFQPLRVSDAKIRFQGNSAGEQVEEVFDAGDTEYRVRFELGGSLHWQGYLATDLWKDNPRTSTDVIQLDAIDGLALLEANETPFGTSAYTISEAVAAILRGLHDLPLVTSMDWRAKSANIPSDECPLDYYHLTSSVYSSNRREQLEDIDERFLLTVFQAGGRWHLRQTSALGNGAISLKRFHMPPGNTAFGTESIDDIQRSLPFEIRTSKPRSRVQRLRTAQSVYEHGEIGELVNDGSFENDSGAWNFQVGGGEVAKRKKHDNLDTDRGSTQDNTWGAVMEHAAGAPNDTVISQSGELVSVGNPNARFELNFDLAKSNSVPDATDWGVFDVEIGSHSLGFSRSDITSTALKADEGELDVEQIIGSDNRIVIPEGAVLPIRIDFDYTEPVEGEYISLKQIGQIKLSEPARAGDTTLKGKITADVNDLSKNPRVNYHYWDSSGSMRSDDIPNFVKEKDRFYTQKIRVPLHTPYGDSVSGQFFIEWRQFQVDSGTFGGEKWYLDEVSARVKVNGQDVSTSGDALQDDHFGRFKQVKHWIGSGPLQDSPRRIHRPGTSQILDNWKRGAGVSYNGIGLERLTTNTMMRRQRQTLDRRTKKLKVDDVQDTGKHVTPEWFVNIDGFNYEATYLKRYWGSKDRATIELTRVLDAGTTGLTPVQIAEEDGSGGSTSSPGPVEGPSNQGELASLPDGLFAVEGGTDPYPQTVALIGGNSIDVTQQTVEVPTGGIDTDELADDAVTSPKIKNDSVIPSKIDDTKKYTVDGLDSTSKINTDGLNSTSKITTDGLESSLKITAPQIGIDKSSPVYDLDASGKVMGRSGLLAGGDTGTEDYTPKRKEWNITPGGRADFRSLYVDELVTKKFTSDITQALGGSDVLGNSVATLAEDFTVPKVDNVLQGGWSLTKLGSYTGFSRTSERVQDVGYDEVGDNAIFLVTYGGSNPSGRYSEIQVRDRSDFSLIRDEVILIDDTDFDNAFQRLFVENGDIWVGSNFGRLRRYDVGTLTQQASNRFTTNLSGVQPLAYNESQDRLLVGVPGEHVYVVDRDLTTITAITDSAENGTEDTVPQSVFAGLWLDQTQDHDGDIYVSLQDNADSNEYILRFSYDPNNGPSQLDKIQQSAAIEDLTHNDQSQRIDGVRGSTLKSWTTDLSSFNTYSLPSSKDTIKSRQDLILLAESSQKDLSFWDSTDYVSEDTKTLNHNLNGVKLTTGLSFFHRFESGTPSDNLVQEWQASFTEPSTITVNDLPGAKGTRVFESGNWVRLKIFDNSGGGLNVNEVWGKVDNYEDNGDGTQSWTFDRQDSDTSLTGTVIDENGQVIDYGQSGQGLIRRTTEGANAPYSAVETWTGNPIDSANYNIGVIVGNLDAAPSLSNGTDPAGYGLYGDNVFLEGLLSVPIGSTGTIQLGDTGVGRPGLNVEDGTVEANVTLRNGSDSEVSVIQGSDNYVSIGQGYNRSEMGITIRAAGNDVFVSDTSGAVVKNLSIRGTIDGVTKIDSNGSLEGENGQWVLDYNGLELDDGFAGISYKTSSAFISHNSGDLTVKGDSMLKLAEAGIDNAIVKLGGGRVLFNGLSIEVRTSLPTSDPNNEDEIYRDGQTLKISNG